MSARYRPRLAVLELVCALAAGCCSPCCSEPDTCCPSPPVAEDGSPAMAHCSDRCPAECPASHVSGQAAADQAGRVVDNHPLTAEDLANCPPPAACPPVVEKRKHKHAARHRRRPPEPPVEDVVVVGPESQFVPVPTRPVFGPRLDARALGEMTPGPLPIDVQPQVMPSPQVMPAPQVLPSPPPEDSPPKPASASSAGKKQAAKNADLTSSLQILK